MTAAVATLNQAAQVALASCEQRIERGLKTFIDVGQALAEIRDSRLYKGSHDTFEDYCRERWGFSRQRAQQFTSAAELASTIVVTGLPAPTNEGQARALAAVPEPERSEVWREAVERTGGKPTAKAVAAVARERTEPAPTPEPTGSPLSTAPVGSGSASPEPERHLAVVPEPAPAPAPSLRIEPTVDEKQRAVQRDARGLLRRAVEILAPDHDPAGYAATWARQLGPYDEELSELIRRSHVALATLDELIEGCGQ